MLLNNQEITEEIKEEIKKHLETDENKNTTIQNLWDTAKAVLRGKFTVIQAYLRRQEKSQINNLTLHLEELEKKEQTKPKISRRKKPVKNTNPRRLNNILLNNQEITEEIKKYLETNDNENTTSQNHGMQQKQF